MIKSWKMTEAIGAVVSKETYDDMYKRWLVHMDAHPNVLPAFGAFGAYVRAYYPEEYDRALAYARLMGWM